MDWTHDEGAQTLRNNRVLYEAERFPVFQNRMYASEHEAISCPRGDIRLVEDLETGLVYNDLFSPELMAYDANYQNEQAVSPGFKEHLESVIPIIGTHLGTEKIVEVGCGKGYFLELLQSNGFEISGFDPTYEGSNPAIQRHFFEPGIGVSAAGLILRHVLEHVQHPFSFLQQLAEANSGQGRIYIEVPCFDWICKNKVWFDVFYEHVNYFRLSDFHRMFGNVVSSGKLFGDQYMYVVAELASLTRPAFDPEDPVSFPEDFLSGIATDTSQPGASAVWGGASKGVIFSLLKSRSGQAVELVIDINPAKQDLYLPATGLRVHSPEKALAKLPEGSTIYVMNSNYLDEIRQMSRNAYRYICVDHL